MESTRTDRELITQILLKIPIDNLTVTHQAQLMQALGFQSDVPFAKSLFSDTLALKYQQNKGQIQKLLCQDCVAQRPSNIREVFIKIVRLYHEQKIKRNMECNKSAFPQLQLPDPNNVQEIIAFQKSMYQNVVKNMLPHKNALDFQGVPLEMRNFSPYPICPPERSYQRFDNDFFPPAQSPYVPSIAGRSYASSNYSFDEGKFQPLSINKSDPFLDHHSLFMKPKANSFMEIDPLKTPNVEPSLTYQQLREDSKLYKGFTIFNEDEGSFMPVKKVKRESSSNENQIRLQNMKRELERFNEGKGTSDNTGIRNNLRGSLETYIPEKDNYPVIKQSVSQYLQEDYELETQKRRKNRQ